MRVHDLFLLREYDDLETEKQGIISAISGLRADNEDDAKLLDRIYKVLNTGQIGQNISNAFAVPLEGEPLSDKEKALVVQDMTSIISQSDNDFKSLSGMTDMLEKGGVVDIGALDSPLTTFSNVFQHPAAVKVFHALKNYGTGRKQKGPGEYALACLSNKIRLAAGEGDLEIDGIGKVELKSAVSSSGGRIGYGGGSQKAKMDVLNKYAEQLPTVLSSLGGKGGSIQLSKFVPALAQDLPLNNADNKKLREQIVNELLSMDMENFAQPIAQAFGTTDNVEQIEDVYLKQNFAWYKDRDDFDALLLCSFPNEKFAMIKNDADLIAFRRGGQANSTSISIIPTQAGAGREQWAQLTLNKAKV
jgi:hypothetical protein